MPDVQTVIAAHVARNAGLCELLEKKKVNLREPRTIDFHFWAWSENSAQQLAEALVKRKFEVNRRRSASDEDRWSIEATASVSVETAVSKLFTEHLALLAAEYGGQYDGWGTSI